MLKKKGKDTDFIFKKSNQNFIKMNDLMVGSDAYDAMNNAIVTMLKNATGRNRGKGRKTLKAFDF